MYQKKQTQSIHLKDFDSRFHINFSRQVVTLPYKENKSGFTVYNFSPKSKFQSFAEALYAENPKHPYFNEENPCFFSFVILVNIAPENARTLREQLLAGNLVDVVYQMKDAEPSDLSAKFRAIDQELGWKASFSQGLVLYKDISADAFPERYKKISYSYVESTMLNELAKPNFVILQKIENPRPYESQPYEWNKLIPEKRPKPDVDNGKVVLFDVSHGGTAGNSDWVINGGFSDFADALVEQGYTVREYRGIDKNGDGIIRFFDDRPPADPEKNEAIITFEAIKDADVFILAESNRPFRISECKALEKFVASGKGIFFISDHHNADRNMNTWDSTEVFNGYNRSDADKFNIGGEYGDLRNPKDATKGWLVEHFGVRFRFNAIDCFQGASDILAADKAEQVTQHVGRVLIAGGATLAIIDSSKAKGVIYLSQSDPAKGWSHAVETNIRNEDGSRGTGLYFKDNKKKEGPYVVISKAGLGKAAFIGDSSPIEDRTARYRNERNGKQKILYNGWNTPGNAATLCLNIVNWLATQEHYVKFSGKLHPPGIKTPVPLTAIEKLDPTAGKPWTDPAGGYDPWDPDTFKEGAFWAKFGINIVSPQTPDLSTSSTISVAQFLSIPSGKKVSVVGIIQEAINEDSGLRLRDIEEPEKSIMIKIPNNLKDTVSPKRNPEILGKCVVVSGKKGSYMGKPGIRSVQNIELQNK